MMGTETVPETLDFNELTRLSAREEFISRKIISVDDIRNKKIRQQLEVDILFSTELWKALEIVRERDYLWARRAYGHALQN
jgi:hypothetical protein